MKKIIAMLMVFVFLCSSVVLAAWEEPTEDFKAGDEYRDGIIEEHAPRNAYADAAGSVYYSDVEDYSVVGILSALGVMGAAEGTLFKPNMYISRGQFVEGLLRLLNIDYSNSAGLVTGEFYDVGKDSEYYNIVYYAVASDIVSGYGDNSFRPNSVMSYTEAQTCVVRALGYDDRFENYYKIASDIKLTNGKNVKNQMAITRMEMAQLLFNALEAPSCEMQFKNNSLSYTKTGETILNNVWEIHRSEGLVTTSFTESIGSMKAVRNTVVINNQRLKTIVTEDHYMMGYYVKYYYDEDDNLIYMYKHKRVEEIVIDSEDWIGFTADRIACYEVNGRQQKKQIELGYTLLYNGMVPTLNYTDAEIFNIAEGQIRLISNDGGGTYDTVMIEEYTDFILDKYLKTGDEVELLLSNEHIAIDLSDTYMIIFDSNGTNHEVYRTSQDGNKTYDVSALASDSVISVYMEYGTDTNQSSDLKTRYMKIVVVTEKVKGQITGIVSDENIIEIDDKEYKLATYDENSSKHTYLELKKQPIGSTVEYYSDFKGKLVGSVDVENNEDWKYAYLVKTAVDTFSGRVDEMMVFTELGEMKTYDVAEKLKINDKKIKPLDVIPTLKGSASMLNRTIGAVVISLDLAQLIKIKVKDEKIIEIQTIVQSVGKHDSYPDTQLHRSPMSSVDAEHTFWVSSDVKDVVCYNSSTSAGNKDEGKLRPPDLLIQVPYTDSTDPKKYSVVPLPMKSNMIIDFYDITNLLPAVAILYSDVVEQQPLVTGYNNSSAQPVMFDSIKRVAIDEDGGHVTKFSVAQATGLKEYNVYEQSVLDKLNKCEKGALIMLYGKGDEVTDIQPVFYNGKPIGPSNLPWDCLNSGEPAGGYYFYEVYATYSTKFFCMQNGTVVSNGNERENIVLGNKRIDAWQFGGILIYSDDDKKTVGKGSIDQFRGVENYGQDMCTVILSKPTQGSTRQYIAYNFDSNRTQRALSEN